MPIRARVRRWAAAVAVAVATAAVGPLTAAGTPGGTVSVTGTFTLVQGESDHRTTAASAGPGIRPDVVGPARTYPMVTTAAGLTPLPERFTTGLKPGSRVRLQVAVPRGLRLPAGGAGAARALVDGRAAITGVEPLGRPVRPAATSATTGRTLTVLPIFSGSRGSGMTYGRPDGGEATPATLTATFTKMADFWRAASRGRVSASVSVRAWREVPAMSGCDIDALANAAFSAHDFPALRAENDHVAIYFPEREDCRWGGMAGLSSTIMWINGFNEVGIAAHEFGHNLGLHHANSWTCTGDEGGQIQSGVCGEHEYGDQYDVMGKHAHVRLPNAPHLHQIGLIPAGEIATPVASQTYTLTPLAGASGLRALRLTLPDLRTLWVEYRARVGADATLGDEGLAPGVLLHTSDPMDVGGMVRTRLLDLTPYDDLTGYSRADSVRPALPVGQTYSSPDGSFALTVSALTAGAATVRYERLTPDAQPPSGFGVLTPAADATVPTSDVRVTWSSSTDAAGALARYEIYADGLLVASTAPTSRNTTLRLLDGPRTVQIRAYDRSGNVTRTTERSFVVAGTDPVGLTLRAPHTFQAVRGTATLRWHPAAEDFAATGYVVLVDDVVTATVAPDARAATVAVPEGWVRLAVRAVNATGESLEEGTLVRAFPHVTDAPDLQWEGDVLPVGDEASLWWTSPAQVDSWIVLADGVPAMRTRTNQPALHLPVDARELSVVSEDLTGHLSAPSRVLTLDRETLAPVAVDGPKARTTRDGAVTVTWQPREGVTSYVVQTGPVHNSVQHQTLPADATSAVVTLGAGRHELAVRGVTAAGYTRDGRVRITVDNAAPQLLPPLVGVRQGTVGSGVPVHLRWLRPTDPLSGVCSASITRTGSAGAPAAGTSLDTTLRAGVPGTWTLAAADCLGNAAKAAATTRARVAGELSGAYSGRWSGARSASALGGADRRTRAPGATVTYTYTGRSAGIVASRGPDRGRARVYVDGRYVATVDLRSATPVHRQVVWVGSPPAGRHTVRVVVEGTPGRPLVSVDGLVSLD